MDINIENVLTEVKSRLANLPLSHVILFGSYAWGTPSEDSDIDFYIVTRDNFLPSSWKQKRDLVRGISDRIIDLRMQYPIDLIVHTKPMHQKFIETDSSFAAQIMEEGKRLI
jgi:predicted nucleotidyltransferase